MILIDKDIPKSVDVLLIVPPLLRFLDMRSISYPLGLGSLATILKQDDFSVEIYNADIHIATDPCYNGSQGLKKRIQDRLENVKKKVGIKPHFVAGIAKKWRFFPRHIDNHHHPYWQEVSMVLQKLQPKIIGIGSKVVDIPSTLMVANIAKEILPDSTIIVGGVSATTCPDYLMRNPSIDFLVQREGEETLLELTRYLLHSPKAADRLEAIRGIGYRASSGKITLTPSRPLIENLDELPFVDRECVFFIDSQNHFQYYVSAEDMLTSRGCPFQCRFCAAHIAWGQKKPRFRSIDNVIGEIRLLKTSYNHSKFTFWDDSFTLDQKRVIEFCRQVIEDDLQISWLCLMNVNAIDAHLLEIMKQAGCYQIQIGIESGNGRILNLIKKGITLDMIREKVPLIKASGLDWRVFCIMGFPTETKAEMEDTLQLMAEIQPPFVQLSIFCPYPGTDFHEELQKNHSLNDNFMRSDVWYPYNNYTGTMSDKEFQHFAFKAFKYIDNISSQGINAER